MDYRFDALSPEFLKFMARIGSYADVKHGNVLQYREGRLTGEKGPINHAMNHIGEYRTGVPHDHFGRDPRWQLAAAAYNLMMEFIYLSDGHAPEIWEPV